MRKLWVKWLCAILCVIAWTAGIVSGVLAGVWYYEGEYGLTDSLAAEALEWEHVSLVRQAVQDWVDAGMEGELPVPDELQPERSNFRFLVYSRADGWGYRQALGGNVADDIAFGRECESQRWTYRSVYGEDGWLDISICYGVADGLSADDGYRDAAAQVAWQAGMVPDLIGVAVSGMLAGLVLLILLLVYAGRRNGVEGVRLTRHDRIPFDLYLAAQAACHVLIWAGQLQILDNAAKELFLPALWPTAEGRFITVIAVGLLTVEVILVLALLLTTVVRGKGRTLLRNTLIARVLRWLWRGVKAVGRALYRAFRALPMVWRGMLAFLGYLFVTVLIVLIVGFGMYAWGFVIILELLWQGFVGYLICRWVFQWRTMRAAVGEIIAGKTDVQIDAEGFYPDLKEHAAQLNDLGLAIDAAVGERMKSERFKAELITNVSHDLKTPLTSIINYVDLLKKVELDDPTAVEYIQVLDRKSQRLKKLTEDLVEASKASTGALTVVRERLDLAQLIRQALGEYEEKLAGADLTPVVKLPEGELHVTADGRHLWRVLDNLLNNCVKYAMEGTRVYVDAAARGGDAVITVKNISRQGLNIRAEQLMERFVRGDESRTTEGSGLGLSIARSLVELQGGQFRLDIDGDLFKAQITLPMA